MCTHASIYKYVNFQNCVKIEKLEIGKHKLHYFQYSKIYVKADGQLSDILVLAHENVNSAFLSSIRKQARKE